MHGGPRAEPLPESQLYKPMDIPLIVLGALLFATVSAYFAGVLPYPIGWIILLIAFAARVLYLMGR